MDLRLLDAEPSDAEREAIDAVVAPDAVPVPVSHAHDRVDCVALGLRRLRGE